MTELKTRIIKRIKSRGSILVVLVVNDYGDAALHQMAAAKGSKELRVRELAEIFRRNDLFAHCRALVRSTAFKRGHADMRIRMGRQSGVTSFRKSQSRSLEFLDLYSEARLSCCSCRAPCGPHEPSPSGALSRARFESQSSCKRRLRRLC